MKLRIGEQEEPEKQNASAQGPAKKQPEPDQAVTSTIEQLGLTLQKVSDQLREKYGLSDNVKGVVITKVVPNSPAAEKQNASAQGGPAKKQPEPDQAVSSTIEQLGLTLQKVSDQLREKYGLSDNVKGVVVTKVVPNSPAAEKQLQAGDVILEVDQKPVTTPQEVSETVAKLQAQKKRSVLLFVERQGDPRFAALRLSK